MATAALKKTLVSHGGGGFNINVGTITFAADATVEVPTNLKRIVGAYFTRIGSGGEANVLSIDETLVASEGEVVVPDTGAVTVDATANNSNSYFYFFLGY